MPVNLELKIKLKSLNPVKKLLTAINAEYMGILNQTDIYYKSTDGLLKLRIENGKESIIKYLRDEKNRDRFSNYQILKFSSGDAAGFLKDVFNIEAIVKKRRFLYMYNNTRIHLDSVRGLGYFLELETLVLNGKSDARKRFNEIFTLLKLGRYEQFKKSYRDLIMSKSK